MRSSGLENAKALRIQARAKGACTTFSSRRLEVVLAWQPEIEHVRFSTSSTLYLCLACMAWPLRRSHVKGVCTRLQFTDLGLSLPSTKSFTVQGDTRGSSLILLNKNVIQFPSGAAEKHWEAIGALLDLPRKERCIVNSAVGSEDLG